MVRSINRALKLSLKVFNPNEVLLTLLHEVEYMVNSRPLTHISDDPNQPEAITSCFFDLKAFNQFYEGNKIRSKKQGRFLQALALLYWKQRLREC